MSNVQSLHPTHTTPPWQAHQLSYGMKMLIGFAAAFLLIVMIVTGFILLVLVASIITNGLSPRDTIGSAIATLLIQGGLFGASLIGIMFLYPYFNAPTSFKTSYGAIPPGVTALPFEARFQRQGLGRTLTKKGVVRFDADTFFVEAYLTPSPIVQIIIILVLTLFPLIFLGIGLGIIPALILAYYIGRKKVTLNVPYYSLQDLSVKGCQISCTLPAQTPKKLQFYVSTSDGERLYHELSIRWPSLIHSSVL